MSYLDHAATTPMLPAAVAAMTEQLGRVGNPSSLHAAGRAARRVVEEAREQIAAAVHAAPAEVIFTAGGTESDNLAVKGLYWARSAQRPDCRRVLASAVEHHAVLDPVRWLGERQGALVQWLSVDAAGRVDPAELAAALSVDVAMVSVMWANNEIGTVQPIAALAQLCAEAGVPMHSDAVQAAGVLPIDFAASGLAAVTLSAHKLGGPVGIGALLLRRDAAVQPLLHGGGQERDVHSGTLNAAAAAGFAAAVAHAVEVRTTEAARLARLRDRLVAGIQAEVPDAVPTAVGPERLPGLAHVCFPGTESDALLMLLDAAGVAASTGSACTAGVTQASHVAAAIGLPDALARSALRFSLGHTSTDADVDAAVAAIGPAVQRARRAGAQLARSAS